MKALPPSNFSGGNFGLALLETAGILSIILPLLLLALSTAELIQNQRRLEVIVVQTIHGHSKGALAWSNATGAGMEIDFGALDNENSNLVKDTTAALTAAYTGSRFYVEAGYAVLGGSNTPSLETVIAVRKLHNGKLALFPKVLQESTDLEQNFHSWAASGTGGARVLLGLRVILHAAGFGTEMLRRCLGREYFYFDSRVTALRGEVDL